MAKPTQVKILSELGIFLKGLLSLNQKILLFDTKYLDKSAIEFQIAYSHNICLETNTEK